MVPEVGPGTTGEGAEGRADVAIATLAEDARLADGLYHGTLLEEPYFLVHPTGRPAHGLPLIDWPENCSSYTRAWWARQDWLPTATVEVAADDSVVLSMVAGGMGMAILPRLTLTSVPDGVTVVPLDDQ